MTDTIARAKRAGGAAAKSRYGLDDETTMLVLRYGPVILTDARRYSACADDAEDAYQRTLEILLTKAPTDDENQLAAWLRTVARNEALDIARARGRTVNIPPEPLAEVMPSNDALPEDMIDDMADADLGAEALRKLSADQAHCLLAYAEGHTYSEIAALTGFSARKVVRCVTEGRHAFAANVAEVEAGSECARVEPLLQLMADGDAYAHVEARPHLRNCPGCRATLRSYRQAPNQVAALFPVFLAAPAGAGAVSSFGLIDQAGAVVASLHERTAGYAASFQQWLELGGAKKFGVAALAAAAVAGGGMALHDGLEDESGRRSSPVAAQAEGLRETGGVLDRVEAAPPRTARRAGDRSRPRDRVSRPAPRAPRPQAAPRQQAPAGSDNGSSEFLP